MYDYRRQLDDPLQGYRLRLPSEERRNARPHPGRRPSEPLDGGCARPARWTHTSRSGR